MSNLAQMVENGEAFVRKIKESPLLPDGVPVSGYVYEVETGKLREVVPAS